MFVLIAPTNSEGLDEPANRAVKAQTSLCVRSLVRAFATRITQEKLRQNMAYRFLALLDTPACACNHLLHNNAF